MKNHIKRYLMSLFVCPGTLRKHAYSNKLKILPHKKNEKFQIKNYDIFPISAQNIRWYSLEPPDEAVLTSTNNLCFFGRNKKNNVYPCKPQFYYIKGSTLHRHVFVMRYLLSLFVCSVSQNAKCCCPG